jgi:hypothetical protein
MNEALQQQLGPIIKAAITGKKGSQEKLLAIAESLLKEEDFSGAASVFKEAAVAYRISAFRMEGKLEEAMWNTTKAKSEVAFWKRIATELPD